MARRHLRILRSSSKSDAGARFIELNDDVCEAAARLLARAQSLGATQLGHYLLLKNLSRISYGKHKGGAVMIPYNPRAHGTQLGPA